MLKKYGKYGKPIKREYSEISDTLLREKEKYEIN